MLERYPGEVKLVFKNFPLKNHNFARPAAVAALAASKQGKFWEFHDLLFENYNRLNEQKINEIAARLKLNEAEFKENQKNPRIVAQVKKDYEEGIHLGIRGVPTVFINGKKIRDRSMKSLETAINLELEKAKAANVSMEAAQ